MGELLNKISSYNIFNYMLPGVLFAVLSHKISDINLLQDDIFVGVFVYYFFGLVLSRIGSIIVEPLLRRLSTVRFADYESFVRASSKDPNLEVLSETNNMYRTLVALVLVGLLLRGYMCLSVIVPQLMSWLLSLSLWGLLFLFILAFRKQTVYISRRISAIEESHE